jgi:hypothetical protein
MPRAAIAKQTQNRVVEHESIARSVATRTAESASTLSFAAPD